MRKLNEMKDYVFSNDLDNRTECTLSRSADDGKLGGVVDRPLWSTALQRNINRPEKRADRNLGKFNKGESPVSGKE